MSFASAIINILPLIFSQHHHQARYLKAIYLFVSQFVLILSIDVVAFA